MAEVTSVLDIFTAFDDCSAAMDASWEETDALIGEMVALMVSLVARGAIAAEIAEASSEVWTVLASFCCKDEMLAVWAARALFTAAKALSTDDSSAFRAKPAATSLALARGAIAEPT
jgi:hypothetical protein